jgi:hypothetical protein
VSAEPEAAPPHPSATEPVAPKVERGADPETRERLSRVFGYVEDGLYVGLMILLAGSAIVLLAGSAVTFVQGVLSTALPGQVISLLDRLLLVLMIVELLYTVQVSFREHLITAPPFLLIALIAGVRRILILTAEIHSVAEQGPDAFRNAMIELALLTAMSLALVLCLALLRTRPSEPAPGVERK